MEFFILWSLFAIPGAIMAGNRNRSVFGWFLLSAVFGVFALLILAVLPKLVNGDQLQRHLAQLKTIK